MAKDIFLYALCGSQRRASGNRLLLEALQQAAPAGVVIEICDTISANPANMKEFTSRHQLIL